MGFFGGACKIWRLLAQQREGFTYGGDKRAFVTSIGGTFKCAGYEFVGIYGVYKYSNAVIFEEWEVERDPAPFDSAAL